MVTPTKPLAKTPAARPVVEADRLTEAIELLFFAYRDFISDPDEILARYDFGRAHHRVVHFVGRNPGITVAELLNILRITKQSLARVLKQLIDGGYIRQTAGPEDRRQRRLFRRFAPRPPYSSREARLHLVVSRALFHLASSHIRSLL